MRIISWNVNGLRAVVRKDKWDQLFKKFDPDIVCTQETKCNPDQLPEGNHAPDGYEAYFASSTARKGYSGVGVYTRVKPQEVVRGLDIEQFDEHGRVITLVFDEHIVVNGYFPNGASDTAPLDYKLEFFDEFLQFIERYRNEGYSIIFGGDINVAHTEIDLARPKANKNHIGFLPEEREWIDAFERHGYIDTFRLKHGQKKDMYTYWDLRTRARDRNVGWRLDYWFVSPELVGKVKNADIYTDIYGSDHAPILLDIDL
ncbi:MAG: exodeoxyribonuclease III [Candidatus Paceibacterota bacterium]